MLAPSMLAPQRRLTRGGNLTSSWRLLWMLEPGISLFSAWHRSDLWLSSLVRMMLRLELVTPVSSLYTSADWLTSLEMGQL